MISCKEVSRTAVIRSFIACPIAPELVGAISQIERELSGVAPDAGWVKPRNLHLTLKFLGEVDERTVVSIGKGLARVAGAFPPFEMKVEGLGAFPSLESPRVVWLGITSGSAGLKDLAASIEDMAEECGVPREKRPFTPHLTLARVKFSRDAGSLRRVIIEKQSLVVGSMTVSEIRLMKSDLRSGGPIYTTILQVPLGTHE